MIILIIIVLICAVVSFIGGRVYERRAQRLREEERQRQMIQTMTGLTQMVNESMAKFRERTLEEINDLTSKKQNPAWIR